MHNDTPTKRKVNINPIFTGMLTAALVVSLLAGWWLGYSIARKRMVANTITETATVYARTATDKYVLLTESGTLWEVSALEQAGNNAQYTLIINTHRTHSTHDDTLISISILTHTPIDSTKQVGTLYDRPVSGG